MFDWLRNVFRRKEKPVTVHPVDTRLEIISDGLNQAAEDLQSFVGVLRSRYGEED